jgi:hypothetical protein
MKRSIGLGLVVVLMHGLAGTALAARDGICTSAVTAKGRSSHVEGSDDWKAFKGKVPEGLAKSRAIEAWSAAVKSRCPKSSTLWMRASARAVECEGTPGHTDCTATATPARSVASYVTK